MVKAIDANQLQKIDRHHNRPIYLIHLSSTWKYSGNDPEGFGSYAHIQGGFEGPDLKLIEGYGIETPCADEWITDGVQSGDEFRFNADQYPIPWTEVDEVLGEHLISLVSNYPGYPGTWYGHYTFRRIQTLYVSDRNVKFNGRDYEDYLIDISDVENQIRSLGGYDNGRVTLNFKNDRFKDKNYLIEYLDDHPPEKQYVEIYKLLIDKGEIFGTNVATRIFKGEMGQPYDITELGFKIDCSSILFGKNYSLPLDVIDLQDFPNADPDDVGKYRNIPYGNIKKLVCPWTVGGWVSTLAEDITTSQSPIEISDVARMPDMPFTAMCDNEQILVTWAVGTALTVTREYGGTTRTAHSKGAIFYEKRDYFEAEVSQYPVKSIGDIYALRRGEWVRMISGWTKYINNGDDPPRATILFDDKCKFEEKVNIRATTEPDEGSHIHAIPAGGFSSKQCVPDGSSGATGHANVIDGNTASYCGIAQDEGVQARFDGEANLGVISKVQIWIYKIDTAATGYVQSPNGTNLQTLPAQAGWFRVIKTSGMAWGDSVVVIGGAGGNQIAEIYKIVEYTPAASEVTTHAASGIDVVVTLTGNSVANMFIGDMVAADVEGMMDDVDGTYTGDSYALIERPDHVRRHILLSLLKFDSLDIDDDSFNEVGEIYFTQIWEGYKFAFNLPDVATEAMNLFKIMDEQSRSIMFESGGKFKLSFNSASYDSPPPISQKTFDDSNVAGNFIFGKTDVADIRNKIRGHFFRDYSKSGSMGDEFTAVYEMSNSVSIAKYGEMVEDVAFSCIGDFYDMVVDIINWMVDERNDLKKTVEFDAFWDAMILDNCDHFQVTSNFWSGLMFKTIRLVEIPERQLIHIFGLNATFYEIIPVP